MKEGDLDNSLPAIAQALEYILADRSGRPVLVRYDSLYAGNMAAGKWRPRKNKLLVSHVRRLWTRAHTHLHGRLWTSHVYGHSNHQWNDRADALASQGRGAPPHEVNAAGVGSIGGLWVGTVGDEGEGMDDKLVAALWLIVGPWRFCRWDRPGRGQAMPPRTRDLRATLAELDRGC